MWQVWHSLFSNCLALLATVGFGQVKASATPPSQKTGDAQLRQSPPADPLAFHPGGNKPMGLIPLLWRRDSPMRPTFGGPYWWGDIFVCRDYRIQQNVFNNSFRLLDPRNRELIAGDEKTCRDQVARLQTAGALTLGHERVVILLHGLGRTRESMRPLGKALERAGFGIEYVGYPSTFWPIEKHADHLRKVITALQATQEIHLVGYSMGGLVIRAALRDHHDARIKRVVFLGTPNQGAERADALSGKWVFNTVIGPAGEQLTTGDNGIIHQLPISLPIEFAVIAGGKEDGRGFSLSLPGDDDGMVTVESTQLPGARDFMTVLSLHTGLVYSAKCQRGVVNFLRHGFLVAADRRQPIPLATPKPVKPRPNQEPARKAANAEPRVALPPKGTPAAGASPVDKTNKSIN